MDVGFPQQQGPALALINAAYQNPQGFANVVSSIARGAFSRGSRSVGRASAAKRKRMQKNGKRGSSRSSGSSGRYQSLSSHRVYLNPKKSSKKKRSKRSKGLSKKYVQRVVRNAMNKIPGRVYSYRNCDTMQLTSSKNQCGYHNDAFPVLDATMATVASQYCKQLTSAGAIETISYDIANTNLVLRGTLKKFIQLRNNSSFSAEIHIYYLVPKQQTTVNPKTQLIDGLDEYDLADGGLETNICYFPSDSKSFRQSWKILKRSGKLVLEAGASAEMVCSRKIWWSSGYSDNHSLDYQPGFSMPILFRIQGAIAHDQSTTSNVGIGETTVDVLQRNHIDVKGVGMSNQLPHTEAAGSLATLTTSTQFQATDPGEETFAV